MLHGQATGRAVKAILGQHLQDGSVVADELQHFSCSGCHRLSFHLILSNGVLKAIKSGKCLLSHIPRVAEQWIDEAPDFEKVGVIERPGYRIVKLRFRVVPGFFLRRYCVTRHLSGRAPAILDVNGHGEGRQSCRT